MNSTFGPKVRRWVHAFFNFRPSIVISEKDPLQETSNLIVWLRQWIKLWLFFYIGVAWTSLALQIYKNIHNNTGQQLTSWANTLILPLSLINALWSWASSPGAQYREWTVGPLSNATCPPIFMQTTGQKNGGIASPALLLVRKCNWLARTCIMTCVMRHAWGQKLQRFWLKWLFCLFSILRQGSVVQKLDGAIHWIVICSIAAKNAQKIIKLQIWTWQLIKAKFIFKTLEFNLSQIN